MGNADRYEKVDRDILAAMEKSGRPYLAGLAIAAALTAVGGILWAYQIREGLGVAGYTHPVNWAIYITNFVFWVGIAHSGTLISAVLYLFRARFRTSFNRAAEAMTVFALMVAGLSFAGVLLAAVPTDQVVRERFVRGCRTIWQRLRGGGGASAP